MAVAAKDFIGRVLSGYRLVALLGAGGAGAVFLAERVDDPSIQRAIKVLMPANELSVTEVKSFQMRFLREIQIASQLLHHAHILPILSYHAETSGLSYMELPLMPGGTLADRIATGPISLDDIASYLRQVASALDYAHHQGVIHRDLKGANVLLDRDGTAYLADFGIARMFAPSTQLFDTPNSATLTQSGQIIGTPAYMAPEQFTDGMVTPQMDIYSLGVLAWQLVTGTLPFTAPDPLHLALHHLNTPPPSARPSRPELPEPADAALHKALAKRPEDRFESAGEFAAAFSDGLSGDWHPALSEPASANHTLSVTPAGVDGASGSSDTTDADQPDPRTRLATRKLPESQPRRRHTARAIILLLALVVIVGASIVAVPRILPNISALATQATPSVAPSPTVNPLLPRVAVGIPLYTTNTPGVCDTGNATWFANVQGQQQQCVGDAMKLSGANCDCPLSLVKLQQLPSGAFPESYVIQVEMQSVGVSRTDFFGFKFREQASSPTARTFGGYGLLVNANGEWQYNRYDANGHRAILDNGEFPTTLEGAHIYDLTVNGGDFSLAVDGQTVIIKHDTTYSGGIVDLAAEPRCVISITAVTLYTLP
jgi:serine/threonine protein kinase